MIRQLDKRLTVLEEKTEKLAKLVRQLSTSQDDYDGSSSKHDSDIEEEEEKEEMEEPENRPVWDAVSEWLQSKNGDEVQRAKVGRFVPIIDHRNLRQTLFERTHKIKTKVGTELTLAANNEGELGSAIKKLAASVIEIFMVFKSKNLVLKDKNPNEFQRKFDIVKDLYSLLGNLIHEIKGR